MPFYNQLVQYCRGAGTLWVETLDDDVEDCKPTLGDNQATKQLSPYPRDTCAP